MTLFQMGYGCFLNERQPFNISQRFFVFQKTIDRDLENELKVVRWVM